MSISSGCISTATLELWHRIRYLKAEEEKMDKKGSKKGKFANLSIKDIVTHNSDTPNSDTYQKSDSFFSLTKVSLLLIVYYEWEQYSNSQKPNIFGIFSYGFLILIETSHVIAASMAAYFFDLILFDRMGWQMQI